MSEVPLYSEAVLVVMNISGCKGCSRIRTHAVCTAAPINNEALCWNRDRNTAAPPGPYGGRVQGTQLIRKRTPLGLYRRPMPRVLGGSQGGGRFLMGEIPL